MPILKRRLMLSAAYLSHLQFPMISCDMKWSHCIARSECFGICTVFKEDLQTSLSTRLSDTIAVHFLNLDVGMISCFVQWSHTIVAGGVDVRTGFNKHLHLIVFQSTKERRRDSDLRNLYQSMVCSFLQWRPILFVENIDLRPSIK